MIRVCSGITGASCEILQSSPNIPEGRTAISASAAISRAAGQSLTAVCWQAEIPGRSATVRLRATRSRFILTATVPPVSAGLWAAITARFENVRRRHRVSSCPQPTRTSSLAVSSDRTTAGFPPAMRSRTSRLWNPNRAASVRQALQEKISALSIRRIAPPQL